jgi:glutathione-regulated potassium-efflux system ancillary protein KefG
MKKTLLINGHRNPAQSHYGKALFNAASNLPEVTPHTLIEEYPDFKIDGERERHLLALHQNLVLQFPFYWYSTPSILKEWIDEVFARGWAYGGGSALAGKNMMVATTTGGPEAVYHHDGANRFTMDEFLRPLEQTAHLCGMRWTQPFVMHGVRYLEPEQIHAHCDLYVQALTNLGSVTP